MGRVWWVVLLVFPACKGSNKPMMMQGIGPSGGVIMVSDGTRITIPPGALSQNTNVTISAESTPILGDADAVGPAYVLGPEGTQFALPVTVTMTVDSLPADRSLSEVEVYTAPVGSTSFSILTATMVDDTHVSAQTNHFSIFVPGVRRRVAMDMGTTPQPNIKVAPYPLIINVDTCPNHFQIMNVGAPGSVLNWSVGNPGDFAITPTSGTGDGFVTINLLQSTIDFWAASAPATKLAGQSRVIQVVAPGLSFGEEVDFVDSGSALGMWSGTWDNTSTHTLADSTMQTVTGLGGTWTLSLDSIDTTNNTASGSIHWTGADNYWTCNADNSMATPVGFSVDQTFTFDNTNSIFRTGTGGCGTDPYELRLNLLPGTDYALNFFAGINLVGQSMFGSCGGGPQPADMCGFNAASGNSCKVTGKR